MSRLIPNVTPLWKSSKKFRREQPSTLINGMNGLDQKLIAAVSFHRRRLALYEVREDFPLLRLNKSIEAYKIIATFQTIPVSARESTALAMAGFGGSNEQKAAVRRAFYARMSPCTLAELNAMSFDPSPLDLEVSESSEVHVGDEFMAALRTHEERLSKAEIRRRFLEQLRLSFEAKISPMGRSTSLYESVNPIASWALVTRLCFGGFPNQFECSIQLKHESLEGNWIFSLGSMLGFGGLAWDDVGRVSLEDDSKMAVEHCRALQSIFTEIINMTGDS